jgi:DNA-binding NarL/FixJ family response regulator
MGMKKIPAIHGSADGHPQGDVVVHELDFAGGHYRVISVPIEQPQGLERLSPAENEVIELLLHGLSNADIATARNVALRTVANQVTSILRKLGCSSRAELAARCGSRSKPSPRTKGARKR